MPVALQQFADDPGFQDGAGHGPRLKGFRGGPLGQISAEAGIQEVQFGGFHQAFGQVAMVWFQQIDNAGRLKDGKPALGGVEGHVGVAGQVGHVEQLPGACRRGPQETEKGHFIPHTGQVADVALQIGLDVGAVEEVAVTLFTRGDGRERAAPDQAVQFHQIEGCACFCRLRQREKWFGGIPNAEQFTAGKAQKLEYPDPSGQGFRHTPHHLKLLGAGQPEEIGGTALVAGHLDIGEQFRGVLDLVDQHRRRKTLHEQGRVAFGKGKYQRIVQGDIGSLRFAYMAQKGCFADLAGAGDQQYRELP